MADDDVRLTLLADFRLAQTTTDPQSAVAGAGVAVVDRHGVVCVGAGRELVCVEAAALEAAAWARYDDSKKSGGSKRREGAAPPSLTRAELAGPCTCCAASSDAAVVAAASSTDVAVFAVEHAKCVERVQLANEAFMQARIQETELLARQDYFRQLSELAASYADLSCRVSDAVADLSEASVQLDALHEQANHLAALRLVQREELASRLEEETADAARPPRSPSAPQLDATVSVGSSEDPFPTPGEAAHGASAPPPGADVTKLMEMGFSRDQAAGALETSANDLAGAISLLLLMDQEMMQ